MKSLNKFIIEQIAAASYSPQNARRTCQRLMIELMGISDENWAMLIERHRIKLGNRNKGEEDIYWGLRYEDYTIQRLHRQGVPDLLVGGISSQGHPAKWLIEVKTSRYQVTHRQQDFMDT